MAVLVHENYLGEIFGWLPNDAWRTARIVCKTWMDVADKRRFPAKLNVKISNRRALEYLAERGLGIDIATRHFRIMTIKAAENIVRNGRVPRPGDYNENAEVTTLARYHPAAALILLKAGAFMDVSYNNEMKQMFLSESEQEFAYFISYNGSSEVYRKNMMKNPFTPADIRESIYIAAYRGDKVWHDYLVETFGISDETLEVAQIYFDAKREHDCRCYRQGYSDMNPVFYSNFCC